MAKKRLAIYCFFEASGYVDKYVEHILREINSMCSRLIIVVNGDLQESGRKVLGKYSGELLLRENKGFDGAAYKETICSVGKSELRKYEEVFFCNNSFFGPFIDLNTIFHDMELQECDFWGLSYRNTGIAAFIESYFLVFRENIVQSGALWDYFEQLVDIITYEEARIFFERGIFHFFQERGFTYGSLIPPRKYTSYIECPYEVMCEDGLPILKKKAFLHDSRNPVSLQKAINYIQDNYKEWAEQISAWIQRTGILIKDEGMQDDCENIPTSDFISCVTIQEIQKWMEGFSHIFLYGNGLYSHLLIRIYGIEPCGIIVSDEQWKGESEYKGIAIIKKSCFDFEQDNVGVIIAVSRRNSEEICRSIGKRKNLLYIWNNVS